MFSCQFYYLCICMTCVYAVFISIFDYSFLLIVASKV